LLTNVNIWQVIKNPYQPSLIGAKVKIVCSSVTSSTPSP
jgi:hypothetical protein